MNLLKIFFAQMAFFMVILGGLINTIEKHLPVFMVQTFRYGKFSYNCKEISKSVLKPIEVPKSWFRHFYIFASIATTIALILITDLYVFNKPVPDWSISLLDTLVEKQRYSSVNCAATSLALVLLTLQSYRRLYDTHFVSVFGKNSRMNLTHYGVGFVHYAGAVLAILAEAPKLSITKDENSSLKLSDITLVQIFASCVFLWAWWHQFVATKILASLRKNTNGKVVSQGHHIPSGDLFEYVSNPHLFCEILMYLCLTVILWNNSTWLYITLWVLSNQIETALLSHWWYQEKFPNYPPRNVLIPFVF